MSDHPTRAAIREIYTQPLMDLVFQAAVVHRTHHDPNSVQCSTLLSIKTGGCPEDCGYCSQAARYATGLDAEPLMPLDEVIDAATAAKQAGATRFCMGAAWKKVRDKDLPKLEAMVGAVKDLGLETCMTLGTLSGDQAQQLAEAGLDYYNHNLDTSREHYDNVVSTRCFDERIETLRHVRQAGMSVCCGGILGLGETREDRIGLLHELVSLPEPPESVPINQLVPIDGTPMEGNEPVDPFEIVRTIATARVLMPRSYVRLSAGRREMDDALQALCFLAGANSVFYGDRLLTTDNPEANHDQQLFARLGITVQDGGPQLPSADLTTSSSIPAR